MGYSSSNRNRFTIRKGLDVPMRGSPDQVVCPGPPVGAVGLCLSDFAGLRPKPLVRQGEAVRRGQPLFHDRKHPEIVLTAPGCGVVTALEPGPRRIIESLTIQLEGDDAVEFHSFPDGDFGRLSRSDIQEPLLRSGLWTSLRTRPFGRIPSPASEPDAIFIRAMDTNPLAADPAVIIREHPSFFEDGVRAISRLLSGPVYVCQRPGKPLIDGDSQRLRVVSFGGPHPAGLVGTHIHHLHPVGTGRTVWHLDYQDAIAIGELLRHGRLPCRRIVALGGAGVGRPRLVNTRVGCDLLEWVQDELDPPRGRIISGSVLSGRTVSGNAPFLRRYDSQVSVVAEADSNRTRGRNGSGRGFSFYGLLRRREPRSLTSALGGRSSVLVPLPSFDRVFPLDLYPTPLLRALAVEDVEQAAALGCLELEEEDLALCTFLCPGKLEYGALLRTVLNRLERES